MSNKKIISIILFSACLALEAIGQAPVKVVIDGSMPSHQINRHIYGHFSEHLGRCIYDGFWVSDTMKVAKQGRIRLDIVEALKKIKNPQSPMAGWMFCRRISLARWYWPQSCKAYYGQYSLG